MGGRAFYVRSMRGLGRLLPIPRPEQPTTAGSARGRWSAWMRSLPAIYDLDGLVALDLPWWPFEATQRIERFLEGRPSAAVFEWGSGASTVWLAQRAARVRSIEHDPAWAADVRRHLPTHARVDVIPSLPATSASAIRSAKQGFADQDFTDYVHVLDGDGAYDLIVIDGRAREACLAPALAHLAPGGCILFDNVDRSRYRRAIEVNVAPEHVVWVRGLTPCLPYPTRAALILPSSRP